MGIVILCLLHSLPFHAILTCCCLKVRHKKHRQNTRNSKISKNIRRNDTNGGLSPPLLLVRRLQQLHQCSNITPPFPLNPHPSRTQTAVKSQELSPSGPLSSAQQPPSSHKNSITAPNQDLDKVTPSDPQSSKTDRPSSIVMTPKIARAGPKIFDKVCAFEERRASKDLPGGSASGFGRVSSFDSNDSGNKTDGPSKEGGETLQVAAHKRSAFKQRASSLEDKTSYSQRVQSYQSKFAEELQRIKKLMGKPSLKKAYSTEQLSQGDRLTTGKLEPIPPQVVKMLEARERAMEGRKAGERGENGSFQVSPQGKGPEHQRSKDRMTLPDTQEKVGQSSSQGNKTRSSVTMETAPVHQLPGQPLPSATRTSLSRFGEDNLY